MGLLKSMRENAGLSVRDMARDVSISEETYRALVIHIFTK